jgi:lipoic acid synthetase
LKRDRKPDWLKVRAFNGRRFEQVNSILNQLALNTVCRAANCPNRGECFNSGTATFLLMGPRCTRACLFCDINTGKPAPLDPNEPIRVARAVEQMQLSHVVLTSVTRDDLADGGIEHFSRTVYEIRKRLPESTIEILTPDFRHVESAAEKISQCRPDIFNHNLETVPRLYSDVRPLADYRRSLNLLQETGQLGLTTKSGIMVGMGETHDELKQLFHDLNEVGVSILTIGQYLAPSPKHYPIKRYVTPDEFDHLARSARSAGVARVFSGPLVRSSYRAAEAL